MAVHTKPELQHLHPALLIISSLLLSIIFIALYVFVLSVAFSHTASSVDIYVPSKHGGSTFAMTLGVFSAVHWIGFAILIGELVLAGSMFRKKQPEVGGIVVMSMIMLATIYTATILGNVLYHEWGGLALTLGVTLTGLIGLALSFISLFALVIKKRSRK